MDKSMDNSDNSMDKSILRAQMKRVRAALPNDALSEDASCRILSLPEVRRAKRVFCYVSFGSELETHRIIEEMLAAGKAVCVPKTYGEGRMDAVRIDSTDRLVRGKFGIPEPKDGEIFGKCQIDVAIVPALCYDRDGYRLGYGGGYYDRWLSGFAGVSVGLCADECVVGDAFHAAHDARISVLVTQSRVIRFRKRP